MTKAFRSKFIELKVVGERSVLSESEKRNKDLRLIDFLKSVIVP